MEENLLRIETYLDGKMSQQEQLAFENEWDQNSELKSLMEEALALRMGLNVVVEEEMLSTFTDRYHLLREKGSLPPIPEDFLDEPENNKGKIKPFWWYFGALALAATVAFLLYLNKPSLPTYQSTQELFTEYYEVPSFPESKSISQDSLWQEALSKLRSERYGEARILLKQVLADSSFDQNSEAYLCLGHLEMEEEKYKEAIQAYAQVTVQVQTAEWYMMLAYLGLEKAEEAEILLKRLKNSEFYGEKAESILNILQLVK